MAYNSRNQDGHFQKDRVCKTCGEHKTYQEFDKYSRHCKECSALPVFRCTSCGKIKDRSEFRPKKSASVRSSPPHYTRCLECDAKYDSGKAFTEQQKVNKKAYKKQWRKNNPHKTKQYNLIYRLRMGYTVELYAQMFKEQNGLCAICGNPETVINQNTNQPIELAADHIHVEPPIPRRLLCMACNSMLGNAKDNPKNLEAGAAYLHQYGYSAEPPGGLSISPFPKQPLGGAQLAT